MAHDLLFACAWYLAFAGMGLLVLPLSMRIFRVMPDGGLLLSRPLGWLLISYVTWFLAYLKILPFSRLGLAIPSVAFMALALFQIKRHGAWLVRKLKIHSKTARNGEIITILVFLLFLFARRLDSSINGTEKPMDIMFLNALVVTSTIPPPDPWLAGEPVNYHYGGYLLHAVPAKITGIPAEIAYNLAIPTVAALTASVAFVLGRAMFGRCRWGALSVACTLFAGNLAAFTGIFNYHRLLPDLRTWRWDYLWDTSRVIYDKMPNGQELETINEYPLFTILWGDLHPHFSNMPFVLLFTAFAYAIHRALLAASGRKGRGDVFFVQIPLFLAAAVAGAFTLPTNLFDFPIGSLLLAGVILVSLLRLVNLRKTAPIPKSAILLRAHLIFLPLLAYLLAAPFWLNFKSPFSGPLIAFSEYHTNLFEFLLVFGAHTAATFAYLLFRGQALVRAHGSQGPAFIALLLATVTVLCWTWSGSVVFAVTPLIALTFWGLALSDSLASKDTGFCQAEVFALLLCALSWSLIAGCEWIHLVENYASKRINTLFKFHFPAWLYLGVALPYLVYRASQAVKTDPIRWLGWLPVGITLVMTFIPPVYLFTSLFALPSPQLTHSIDGLDFMKRESPHLYGIIQWLKQNAEPDARLLEIPGCGYRVENLASACTGRPSVIGWVGHEALWHADDAPVYTRKADALRFFTTTNWDEAQSILKKYNVRYVILAQPECEENVQLLPQMLNAAFRPRLEAVIIQEGNIYNAHAPYELYRVPDSP